jgi:hypothetical protein
MPLIETPYDDPCAALRRQCVADKSYCSPGHGGIYLENLSLIASPFSLFGFVVQLSLLISFDCI